jgi:hypothetical protein
MLLWYACLPLAFAGALIGMRRSPFGTAVLLSASLLWVVIAALTGGNVGTAFRSRDLIAPAVLVFASVGAGRLLRADEPVV